MTERLTPLLQQAAMSAANYTLNARTGRAVSTAAPPYNKPAHAFRNGWYAD